MQFTVERNLSLRVFLDGISHTGLSNYRECPHRVGCLAGYDESGDSPFAHKLGISNRPFPGLFDIVDDNPLDQGGGWTAFRLLESTRLLRQVKQYFSLRPGNEANQPNQ